MTGAMIKIFEGITIILFFYILIRSIERKEEIKILNADNIYKAIFIAAGILIFTIYKLTGISFFITNFYLFYLLTSAWIDEKTMFVYGFINRIALLVGIVFFAVTMISRGSFVSLVMVLSGVLLYDFIILVQEKVKCFGRGDSEIYIINSLYLSCLFDVSQLISILLLQSFVSVVLFLFLHIRCINWKEHKMKKPYALVPSIFLANVLLFILYL